MTIINLHQAGKEKRASGMVLNADAPETAVQQLANALVHPNTITQQLLTAKVTMHRPEAGLNPLVDAAAAVFSTMGRLKHLKFCHDLSDLQHTLVQEIEGYLETVQAYNQSDAYLSEYIPITCYALCATLDDVIATTPWGGQGKWNNFSLVAAFNQEPLSQKSFFIILERLVRDPDIYIDVMEFMYICLSLGFKCHFNTSAAEFDHEQLEQITNSLYKRIRSYRGNFSKTLSPYSVRASVPQVEQKWFEDLPGWAYVLIGAGALALFMLTGKLLLNNTYDQTSQYIAQTERGGQA